MGVKACISIVLRYINSIYLIISRVDVFLEFTNSKLMLLVLARVFLNALFWNCFYLEEIILRALALFIILMPQVVCEKLYYHTLKLCSFVIYLPINPEII